MVSCVPATLLGRLAVDPSQTGAGIGEFLLMDALARSYGNTRHIASYAVIVDAKNEAAVSFYQKYDFMPFADHPNRLFLPMNVIARLGS